MTEWPNKKMTEWQNDGITNDQMTKGQKDSMTEWLNDWMKGSFTDDWPYSMSMVYLKYEWKIMYKVCGWSQLKWP